MLCSTFYISNSPRSLSAGNSRPRTPPSSSSHKDTHRASNSLSRVTSPPRRNYSDFLSHTNNDWNTDDEDEDDDDYEYENDDGDDFGLPCVSSMKRKSNRIPSTDSGSGISWGYGSQDFGLRSRRLSNSADIAIERPAPSYPTPKKSEGKILRPQYKEILRGTIIVT